MPINQYVMAHTKSRVEVVLARPVPLFNDRPKSTPVFMEAKEATSRTVGSAFLLRHVANNAASRR